MPTATTLDKETHRGHLYCLRKQGLTPRAAHTQLRYYTEDEVFTLEEVEQLFADINIKKYRLNTHKYLLLAEDGVFNDTAVIEFLTHRYAHTFYGGLYTDLLKVTGKELFNKKFVSKWNSQIFKKDHLALEIQRDFNKNSLRGFLVCLFTQNNTAEQAHEKLLAVTGREVFSLAEVEKFFEQIRQGDYLVQEHADRLWRAVPQYNFMKNLVEHADLNLRKALYQTCRQVKELIDNTDCRINSVHVNFIDDTITIFSDPKIAQETYQSFQELGCAVHSNGKVWYKKSADPEHHQILAKKKLDILTQIPNVTVANFKLNADLSQSNVQNLSKYYLFLRTIRIENLYLKIDNFAGISAYLGHFVPETLRKLVIFAGNHRFSLRVMAQTRPTEWERWTRAEVLITNQRFEDIENGTLLSHFKFALFELHYVITVDQVLAIRDNLLFHPELREFKISCQMLPDHHDEINTRLGTYNARGTRVGRWAQFPYPAPNKEKFLELCVLEGVVWFRGPGFVPGECERAEEELRDTEHLNEGVFKEFEYLRNGHL
ncbi:unnamed protein product [Caenorhabditis brenneri]